MTTRKIVPAFIDPPSPYAPLAEWVAFRAELERMTAHPGLERFIRQADDIIARLSRRP
jgi:hypothetical protein